MNLCNTLEGWCIVFIQLRNYNCCHMNISEEWDRTNPKLFGYLINTLRDKALAEDILQTTWVKALQKLPQFKARGGGFAAYLFTIAHNECRQYWRRAGRETPLNPLIHDVADPTSAGKETLLAEQILSKLPQTDRELLRLRYIADLSMNDIARVLNSNSIAVRVRVHRALARARKLTLTPSL